MDEKNIKLKLLNKKLNNIFNHILLMIDSNSKYVFSEACEFNLKRYFNISNQINEIKKQNILC